MPKIKGSRNKTASEKLAEIQQNRRKHSKCVPFYDRLIELCEEKKAEGTTYQEIAWGISNLSDSALAKWTNAESEPKVSSLLDMAKYFDVSLDFLCGLSDIKKTDADLTASAKFTGLSEKALENINKLKNEDAEYCDKPINILNTLLSYDYDSLLVLLNDIASINNAKTKLNNRITELYSRMEEGKYTLPSNIEDSDKTLKVSYFNSVESFKDLIENIYQLKKILQDSKKAVEKISEKMLTKKKKLSDVDSSQMSIFDEKPQRSE